MATAEVVLPSTHLARGRKTTGSSVVRSTLALLDEDDRSLQEHALRRLYDLVDTHWAEAADSVAAIEALADAGSQLAAAVASKVYYHLEAYPEAVRLALAAGPLFDVDGRSEYVETIVARCIDEYASARVHNAAVARGGAGNRGAGAGASSAASASAVVPIDARLEAVVDRMFARCWRDGSSSSFRQALGVALESRRLDAVLATVMRAVAAATAGAGAGAGAGASSAAGFAPSPGADFVAYLVDIATATGPTLAPSAAGGGGSTSGSGSGGGSGAGGLGFVGGASPLPKDWRMTLLRAAVPLFHAPAGMSLADAAATSAAASSSAGDAAEAEMIAAASAAAAASSGSQAAGGAVAALVSDYATLARVLQALDNATLLARLLLALLHAGVDGHEAAAAPAAADAAAGEAAAAPAAGSAAAAASARALSSPAVLLAYQIGLDAVESDSQTFLLHLHNAVAEAQTTAASGGADAAQAAAAAVNGGLFATALQRLLHVLDGSLTAAVFSDFLSHGNAADGQILVNTKAGLPPGNAALNHALVVAHGYMQCGTSVDSFLRANLDWLGKAANWHKFSACASQGVVHKGRLGDAFTLLAPYLPREGEATADAYAEGGALFALGLIHANRGAAAAAGVEANPADVLQPGGAGGAAGGGAGAGAGAAGHAGGAGGRVTAYLHDQLRGTMHEVLQHGAALGLGCAGMGTGDGAAFASLRDVLFSEKAVASEGAALGIGLLLTGRGPAWTCDIVAEEAGSAAGELLAQAHDTAHEKTIRGIGMALALQCYGHEEGADALIAQLTRDKDAVLRYGGMFALALAYAGTGSNAAVRQALHVAVTDVSDDVRRAAVLSLGFILCRAGREVPHLVAQLAESYNPHVRYGAALATGIACAGSGMPDAVGLLEPLLGDPVDFVRQGALLGLALVLQQEAGGHLPKAAEVREKLAKLAGDKHVPSMARMGAILGQGIMDAGGRNAITSLVSRSGFLKMSAVVGMALWLQHWYWYPTFHFLSLALTPTPLVGLTGDFSVPSSFAPLCKAPPSWFAYPPKLEAAKDDKETKVTTLTLSTTAKARAKAAAKKKEREGSGGAAGAGGAGGAGAGAGASDAASMSVDGSAAASSSSSSGSGAAAPAMATDDGAAAPTAGTADDKDGSKEEKKDDKADKDKDGKDKEKKEEKEATSFALSNPCRVTLSQAKFVDFAPKAGQRYLPVRPPAGARLSSGILLLLDTTPGEKDEGLKPLRPPAAAAEGADDDGPDAAPPAPFDWIVGSYY